MRRRGQRERSEHQRGDRQGRRHQAERVGVAQAGAQDHRPDRVAHDGHAHAGGAEQLRGAAGDVEAHERDDAGQADEQPGQARAVDPLGRVEAQGEQRDRQRHGRDEDRGQRRGDVASPTAISGNGITISASA